MNPNFKKIEELYNKSFSQYVSRFTRSTGSEAIAEDVVHDAFERAMKYWDAYDETQEIERWFARILRNSYRDFMKAERGQLTEELDEFAIQGVECDGLIRRIWKEVEALIDVANPVHKEILTLHYLKDYTATDISRFTDHSLSNVCQVISRFRNKVRTIYGIA